MPKHKFSAGAVVVVSADPPRADFRPGLYKILQAVPPAGSRLQYRVQNAADSEDRLVDEEYVSAADRW
jgi:hypothetical protein